MAEISDFIGEVSVERFLLFLFVVIFTFILGSLSNILVRRFMKERVRAIIYKPISKAVMYSVYALGLFLAFNNIIHFNVPAGLAALGILGVAILLPAVPILQNIAAVSNMQMQNIKSQLLSSRTFRFKSGPWRFSS